MTNLINMKVVDFISEIDSDSPAPGGGSVSSLVSTIGCALARMVGHLSFGKKKYEAISDNDKTNFLVAFNHLKTAQNRLEILVDEDTKSFGIFMDAMKLPKDTDNEKSHRAMMIEEATKEIIKVPYEIAQVSLDALNNLAAIIKFGNKNAITDAGVAALLLNAGIEGAVLNVKINLSGLTDIALVNQYKHDCNKILEDSNNLKRDYLKIVNDCL